MKPAASVMALTAALACAPSPRPAVPAAPTPPGSRIEEGASLEAAVLIEAATEREGVDRENDWIFRRYGRFRKKTVALASRNGRRYDVITVQLADGSERVFYFDITDFFGK